MASHDEAVRSLVNEKQQEGDVKTTWVDNVERYPDPEPIGGEVPDIVVEYTNGHRTIVEVDTRPMNENEEAQDETFRRSAGQQSATTYEHFFADDVL